MLVLLWTLAALAVTPDEVVAKVNAQAEARGKQMSSKAPKTSEANLRAAATKTVTGLESVEGHSAKIAWGVAVVDVGMGPLWNAVNDDMARVKWTKLDYVEVVSGKPCGADRQMFQYLPISLVSDRYWVLRLRQNAAIQEASGGKVRENTWLSVDPKVANSETAEKWKAGGIPIAFAEGGWMLTEIDASHTLVEYWTWSDPGGRIPAGLASSFASGGIEDTIQSMVDLAKAGPACSL